MQKKEDLIHEMGELLKVRFNLYKQKKNKSEIDIANKFFLVPSPSNERVDPNDYRGSIRAMHAISNEVSDSLTAGNCLVELNHVQIKNDGTVALIFRSEIYDYELNFQDFYCYFEITGNECRLINDKNPRTQGDHLTSENWDHLIKGLQGLKLFGSIGDV